MTHEQAYTTLIRSGSYVETMESNYCQMNSYIEQNEFPFKESAEQNCRRIDVQHGKTKCTVKV
jgi:hypothetical protein